VLVVDNAAAFGDFHEPGKIGARSRQPIVRSLPCFLKLQAGLTQSSYTCRSSNRRAF